MVTLTIVNNKLIDQIMDKERKVIKKISKTRTVAAAVKKLGSKF